MKLLILLLVFILAVVALVWGIGLVVSYFSEGSRYERKAKKQENTDLLAIRKELSVARANLIKIAANDSGNPTLEAQLALEQLSRMENKES